VSDVRSVSLAACLAAAFAIFTSSSSIAASASQKANASYASNASRSSEPVPANCIRQECGKLWCWQMGHGKTSSR
jgi:hypothetical protein